MTPEKKILSNSEIDHLLKNRFIPKTPKDLSPHILEKAFSTQQVEETLPYLSFWSELLLIIRSCFPFSPSKIAVPVFIVGLLIGGFTPPSQQENIISNYFNQTYQYGYTP